MKDNGYRPMANYEINISHMINGILYKEIWIEILDRIIVREYYNYTRKLNVALDY